VIRCSARPSVSGSALPRPGFRVSETAATPIPHDPCRATWPNRGPATQTTPQPLLLFEPLEIEAVRAAGPGGHTISTRISLGPSQRGSYMAYVVDGSYTRCCTGSTSSTVIIQPLKHPSFASRGSRSNIYYKLSRFSRLSPRPRIIFLSFGLARLCLPRRYHGREMLIPVSGCLLHHSFATPIFVLMGRTKYRYSRLLRCLTLQRLLTQAATLRQAYSGLVFFYPRRVSRLVPERQACSSLAQLGQVC